MRYIPMTGEEGELRMSDGRQILTGPGEYLAEDGTYLDDLGGGLRERGTVCEEELALFDFDQFGFLGHSEWDGSNHVLVEDEPSRESAWGYGPTTYDSSGADIGEEDWLPCWPRDA